MELQRRRQRGTELYGEFPGQLDYTYEYNGALLLANKTDQAYYFENNAYGQWTWQAPRQSWIYRADFVNLHFDPTFGAEAQCVDAARAPDVDGTGRRRLVRRRNQIQGVDWAPHRR